MCFAFECPQSLGTAAKGVGAMAIKSSLVFSLGKRLLNAEKAFEERHYPVTCWARMWGFSAKTVREWFRGEFGSGILQQPNTGRRAKRDYTTIMISGERSGADVCQAHCAGANPLRIWTASGTGAVCRPSFQGRYCPLAYRARIQGRLFDLGAR